MPLRNPITITITIAVPGGDGEQILTVIGDEDEMQNWQLRNAAYTAQNRDRILADVTAGAWALKLPPNASYGHEVEVLIDGINALSIDPNGAKVNGTAGPLAVTSDRAKLAIVYKDATSGWIVGTGSTASSPTPTPTPTSPYSTEAQAVINAITATGITLTDAQKQACHNRIEAHKTDGTWNKLIGYYGLLGGTAASHRINWKNPGTYNLNWTGGTVNHSAQGVQSAGGYGDTGYNPSTGGLITNSGHLSAYCRTNSALDCCDIGVYSAVGGSYKQWVLLGKMADNNLYYEIGGYVFASMPDTLGSFVGSHFGTTMFVVKDQAVLNTSPSPGNFDATPINSSLSVMNRAGALMTASNRSYGSFSFGTGFTTAEAIAFSVAEQTYQTALGRQV